MDIRPFVKFLLKYAPQLNAQKIHPHHFSKMNVNPSSSVISRQVAAALVYLSQVVVGREQMRTSAWFITLLRMWFDHTPKTKYS